MRAEEIVDRQRFQDAERLFEVFRNARIGRVADELVSGIHVRTTDDDDVALLREFSHYHGPGSATFRVARRETRRECGISEFHSIAVAQYTIDLRRRVKSGRIVAILEVILATRFDHVDVALHHHVFGARELFDRRAAGTVIEMRMTDQKNLDVVELESQRLDTLASHPHTGFEITVDENVSFRRGDQVACQTFTSDVVKISGDAKRGKGFGPILLNRWWRFAGNDDEREDHR